jgi:microcystin-dependent protein
VSILESYINYIFSTYSIKFKMPPVGTVLCYGGSKLPDDYLSCNGANVCRRKYHKLFKAIGTIYGSGNGCTTFTLPDLRGRVVVGCGSGTDLTSRSLGDASGEEYHTLTIPEIPSHNHTGTTTTDGSHNHSITDPGHTHTMTTINDDFNDSGANPPGFTGDSAGSRTWDIINSGTTGIAINTDGLHNHTFTTSTVGGDSSHNNMQPYLVLKYIIRYD